MSLKYKAIPRITVPSVKPHEKAINNKHEYDQDFWELDYAMTGYLSGVLDDELFSRHLAIIKNMQSLTSPDRHTIPISCFLSSWYWFRKEHQTRYEMAKRDLPLPAETKDLPLLEPTNQRTHIRPIRPNAGNILYRYTEPKFAEAFLKKGSVYLSCATKMSSHKGDKARFDIETSKSRFSSKDNIKFTTMGGKNIPIISDLKRTSSSPDYYLFCVSTDYDPILLNELGGACVAIKDPEKFSLKLQQWGEVNMPDWFFGEFPIEYYDPYEHIKNHVTAASMTKGFEFAYQREFRFAFGSTAGLNAVPIPPIELGNLEDIAEII
jgi:hypothetical protein